MILIRSTTLSPATLRFAAELRAGAGLPVAHVLDGRHEVAFETREPRVMVTEEACRALGLYCPGDFRWRCGDYGMYLARQQFADTRHFWLIEYDIRLAGGELHEFFELFAKHPEVDLLACHLRPAQRGWRWHRTAGGRDAEPCACTFGIVRISARALDACLSKRRRHASSRLRRADWPNDEALVATTVKQAGYSSRDFNDFGRQFYDATTWSLHSRIDGDNFQPPQGGVMIYHPVLFGSSFKRGNFTLQELGEHPTRWQKVLRRLNMFARW